MSSKSGNVNVEVPADMLEEITKYMEELKVKSKVKTVSGIAPVVVSKTRWEVKKVIGHRISSSTGEYSFLLQFSDKSTEWVTDSNCTCEYLIREHLGPKHTTAYLICRVSTKAQDDHATCISLEAQERALVNSLVGDRNYDRVKLLKIVGSAYTCIQPEIMDIIDVARSNDTIRVWRIDRLSRNMNEFAGILENLYKRGVQVASIHEKLTYNDETRLVFLQHLLDAQKDAAAIGSRVKATQKYMRDRGDEAIGRLKYGKKYSIQYKTDENGQEKIKKKLVVDDPLELEIVDKIKLECSKSRTYGAIAEYLNKNGKYKRGKMWSPAMIRGICKRVKPPTKAKAMSKAKVQKK